MYEEYAATDIVDCRAVGSNGHSATASCETATAPTVRTGGKASWDAEWALLPARGGKCARLVGQEVVHGLGMFSSDLDQVLERRLEGLVCDLLGRVRGQ
jgi:hypothetical protein